MVIEKATDCPEIKIKARLIRDFLEEFEADGERKYIAAAIDVALEIQNSIQQPYELGQFLKVESDVCKRLGV